ncbi:M23 family metallopeptidase [Salinarimonas ramus]|uniref:Membrane protein n=1 Tax=Salinarimonas ramus TaxID=690164 RepID=A0A917Q6S4_9HYPH|nr:M23 family metallopeptidase [Salinarimonas ramus]GGK31778.1 membrane protein [Salinarimonas ramus]
MNARTLDPGAGVHATGGPHGGTADAVRDRAAGSSGRARPDAPVATHERRDGDRPRASSRSASRLAAPLGGEPPLDPAGDDAPIARRAVSWRWLAGGVLTGATGALLIGAAIVVAVEGSTALVAPAERMAEPAPARTSRAAGGAAAKEDRLLRTALTVTATSTFEAPMAHRVGEREMIRVQSFTRLATGLASTTGVHATDIPRFDPMRYLADSGEDAAEPVTVPVELAPEEADVTVLRRGLADVTLDPVSPALSDADATAQVAEERRIALAAGQRRALPLPAQAMLGRTVSRPAALSGLSAYAAVDETAPFDSIEVRVIPENVSTLPKSDPREEDDDVEDIVLALGREESLPQLLAAQGIAAEDIAGAVSALGGAEAVGALPAGQPLRALVREGMRPGDPRRLLRVVLYGENGVEAIAAVTDAHAFVAVPVRAEPQEEEDVRVAAADEGQGGARLYESLFETGLKHGLSRDTVEELVQVFAYDVDFQRRVQPGDAIDVFFTQPEADTAPEILSAALTIGGETTRVFRFHDPESGAIEYFDPEGRSLKMFLMRKPIAEGRLTSGFGMRRHPVLRYARQHTGVDWANRVGTPIFAAGAGTVTVAGWEGGYGRRVEIQHANGYVTTYSHMSRIGDGISPGTRVTQGQVIGYLGNSGLSTGPHLHYEVMVNGRFVDPLKIRVPRSRELDGRALADFTRQREQIESLLQRAGGPVRFAQTTGG